MKTTKLAVIGAVLALTAVIVHSADFPSVHPDSIVSKYGKPDVVKSTEYDNPRPPIVTRMLEYRKESVRFVFFPDTKLGTPPPYSRWKMLGVQDPRDNSVLTAEEVLRRMRGREKR